MKKMAKKKNPLAFMDVSVDGDPAERMVFEVVYSCACELSIVCTQSMCSIVFVVCF